MKGMVIMSKEYIFPSKDLLNDEIKNKEDDRYYPLSKVLLKKELNDKLIIPIGVIDNKEKYYLDLKDATGISITDLGLNDFRMDLVEYVKENGDLEGIPFGLHSVVHENKSLGIEKGVIYVLKNINN